MFNLNILLTDIDKTLSAEIKKDGPCVDLPKAEDLKLIQKDVLWGLATVICVNFNFAERDKDIPVILRVSTRKLLQDEIRSIFEGESIYRAIFSFKDRVYVVVNTPLKDQVSQTLELIAKVNSMMAVFNIKYRGKGWPIIWAIGTTYGDVCVALDKDDHLSWSGEAFSVVEEYTKECGCLVKASSIFVDNLKQEYQKFFTDSNGAKTASVINIAINEWVKENS